MPTTLPPARRWRAKASDTEDALKDSDITSGTGQDEVNPQQSDDKVTGGATEQNPNVDEPEIGGP